MKVKDGLMLFTGMKLMLRVGYSSCGKTKSNSEFGFNDLKSLILMNSIYIYLDLLFKMKQLECKYCYSCLYVMPYVMS